ncbi:477_t:CDS:2, partial [Acaulospora colombiana]
GQRWISVLVPSPRTPWDPPLHFILLTHDRRSLDHENNRHNKINWSLARLEVLLSVIEVMELAEFLVKCDLCPPPPSFSLPPSKANSSNATTTSQKGTSSPFKTLTCCEEELQTQGPVLDGHPQINSSLHSSIGLTALAPQQRLYSLAQDHFMVQRLQLQPKNPFNGTPSFGCVSIWRTDVQNWVEIDTAAYFLVSSNQYILIKASSAVEELESFHRIRAALNTNTPSLNLPTLGEVDLAYLGDAPDLSRSHTLHELVAQQTRNG